MKNSVYKKRKEWIEKIPKKRCKYCLSSENLTYDHKTPLVRGGLDGLRNIEVLCRECNGYKSGLTRGEVMRLSAWLWNVNQRRIAAGKAPLGVSKRFFYETISRNPL